MILSHLRPVVALALTGVAIFAAAGALATPASGAIRAVHRTPPPGRHRASARRRFPRFAA